MAEGTTAAAFPVTTSTVGSAIDVAISGTYGGTETAALRVASCADWSAPPPVLGGELVWFDDSPPTGAALGGTWVWATTQKASGTQSHLDPLAAGLHQHYFENASPAVYVGAGDTLITYVLLDPCNPPRELMLPFRVGTSWEYRAYWGENLIGWGTNDSPSRRPMGALPPVGEWVRLEVPASLVGLEGKVVNGAAFTLYDGRAWFDRLSVGRCAAVAALPALDPAEVVWFDDAPPAGASLGGAWLWDSEQRASGSASHHEAVAGGFHQHYFQNATTPFTVGTGDTLVTYVLIDPCRPPREVMLIFRMGTSWEHRAYWGENLLGGGTDGTNSRRYMGPLPAAGGWVRLEVPASAVGLEGASVNGMAFALYDGHAWFDRSGKIPAGSGAGDEGTISSDAAEPPASDSTLGAAYDPIALLIGADLLESVTGASSGGRQRVSIYLPELHLLTESAFATATPTAVTDYVWFAGQPLAQIDVPTGAVRWAFNDHLGTPLVQTDASGAVVWRLEQEPYGAEVTFRAGSSLHQPLRFPGQERGWDNEVSYNVFRWFRSGMGRYTQADPADFLGDPHPYLYVMGQSVNAIDPFGLATVTFPNMKKVTIPPSQLTTYCPPKTYACTVFSKNPNDYVVSCECSCSGLGDWRMSLGVQIFNVSMCLTPPVQKSFAHENLHLAHLEKALTAVEQQDFVSKKDCDNKCLGLKTTFTYWMGQWANQSNKDLH